MSTLFSSTKCSSIISEAFSWDQPRAGLCYKTGRVSDTRQRRKGRKSEIQHSPDELVVKDMTERPMAKVVAESGDLDALDLMIGDVQLWLGLPDLPNELPAEVADPHRVLKPVMGAPREHHVGAAQLLQAPQSLEMGSVDEVEHELVQHDVPVDRVIDPLQQWKDKEQEQEQQEQEQ